MEPVRGNHYTQFYHAWAESIDLEKQSLRLMPAYPPAFREADPLQTPSSKIGTGSYPNARGGHSTMLAIAPHRRAIEAKEGAGEDAEMKASLDRSDHSHGNGESWRSMEEGREYDLTFDKLVIS